MQATEPVTQTFGRVTITTWTDHEGISIQVFTGGRRNSLLSATYLHEDRDAAKAWYRHVRDAATAGTPTWQIEAQMSALIDAAQAAEGDGELAADVAATMDAVNAERDAQRATLARDLAQIVRPVRITRTGVHRKPLNDRQHTAIRSHRDGVVHLGPGVTRPMLEAIADKGYGTLNHVPHLGLRKVVQSLTLNKRGLAAAEVTQ